MPASAAACTTLNARVEAKREKQQERYLRANSNKRVRGTFAYEPGQAEAYDESHRIGTITTADGRKFRIAIRNEINCGFPLYALVDGDAGLFYLKKPKYPDDDDLDDGIFDDYDYVHFRLGRRD